MNRPLTSADLTELERMLVQGGVGAVDDVHRAKKESRAAKAALAEFVAGKTLSANQIEFVNLIVDHLTEHGVMNAALLYGSPFTDVTPRGPDGLFDELMAVLEEIRATAAARHSRLAGSVRRTSTVLTQFAGSGITAPGE